MFSIFRARFSSSRNASGKIRFNDDGEPAAISAAFFQYALSCVNWSQAITAHFFSSARGSKISGVAIPTFSSLV